MQTVSNKKLLTHEETMKLIEEAQAGSEEAKDTLVERNTRLVWNVLKSFSANKYHDTTDLFQEGVIGLIKSIERFDTSYGVRFSTYAVPMISGEIRRYIRDTHPVKISRKIIESVAKIHKQDLVNKHPSEVSEILGIPEDIAKDALTYIHFGDGRYRSMEEETVENGDGDTLYLGDFIPGDVNKDNWFDHMAIREAVNGLGDREKRLIELRYYKDYTQTQVAKELGVSQVQVSRLEKKAIEQLKELYESKEDDEMSKVVKGNREEAIRLLKNTSKTLKEISVRTGVPLGTLGYLANKHRPKHITEMNKRKSKHKQEQKQQTEKTVNEVKAAEDNEGLNLEGTTTGRLSSKKPNLSQAPVAGNKHTEAHKGGAMLVEGTKVPKPEPKKVVGSTVVSFDFNLNIEGEEVAKEEAIAELRKAADMLETVNTEKVSFRVHAGN